jgi:hypothetical protein
MENPLMGLRNGEVGISRVIHEKRIYPQTFGQCGRFSFTTTDKKYVKGHGIVLWIVENEVFYICNCQAFPYNFGGACKNNLVVCKNHITMCEICGRYLCLVPGCCNPVIIEGKVSCNEHLFGYGFRKLLGV